LLFRQLEIEADNILLIATKKPEAGTFDSYAVLESRSKLKKPTVDHHIATNRK
jgi:hypothetical protein